MCKNNLDFQSRNFEIALFEIEISISQKTQRSWNLVFEFPNAYMVEGEEVSYWAQWTWERELHQYMMVDYAMIIDGVWTVRFRNSG